MSINAVDIYQYPVKGMTGARLDRAVLEAGCGVRPAVPERLARALSDRERMVKVPADTARVAETILELTRAAAA